jgi:hypothetical protein
MSLMQDATAQQHSKGLESATGAVRQPPLCSSGLPQSYLARHSCSLLGAEP